MSNYPSDKLVRNLAKRPQAIETWGYKKTALLILDANAVIYLHHYKKDLVIRVKREKSR